VRVAGYAGSGRAIAGSTHRTHGHRDRPEHNMSLLRALTDVDVPGAESERPRHCLLLVLEGRARQIEVQLVLAGLLLPSWKKSDPEPSVIARQERNAVWGVVGHLPAQDAGPEARETERVVRIEAEREEVTSHSAPHLRSADSRPLTGHALRAHRESNVSLSYSSSW
jgi:hypothetical protein